MTQRLWGVITPDGSVLSAHIDQALAQTDADTRIMAARAVRAYDPDLKVEVVLVTIVRPADNPAGVKVGQVWRSKRFKQESPRRVVSIDGRFAKTVRAEGTPLASRIRLSRFQHDYTLIPDAPVG